MRAHMRGLRLMLVSVGQNGFLSNWTRISLFMELYTKIYGPPNLVNLTPNIGIDNSRTGQAECICLVNLGTYLAGFYSSIDIIDHNSRKTVNRRLTALQEDLGTISGSNVAWGQARMATG
jgi:hypothetical protein